MNQPRTFVDTNILLYSLSPSSDPKSSRANEVILALKSQMVVSTQVLQEFYAVSTRKRFVQPQVARSLVMELSEGEVVSTTATLISDAIDLSIVNGFSIWDSLIVQAAIQSRCSRLLTEDLQNGQMIKGVRIENPFL